MTTPTAGTILIVDDDQVDREFILRAIKKCRPDIKLIQAVDGNDALKSVATERPDLIIMDIQMPKLNGRETLHILKSDPAFSSIPIIMMSTSSNDEDVEYCYQQHANAYLTKTVGKQSSDLQRLLAFWFGSVIRSGTNSADSVAKS